MQQHHHQLDRTRSECGVVLGAITSGKTAPLTAPSSIVIQLPGTSANNQPNQRELRHQTNQSQTTTTTTTSSANTTSDNASTTTTQHSQAAACSKRELMLEQQQQSYKHRYWRRDYVGATRSSNMGRLFVSQTHHQQQQQVVASVDELQTGPATSRLRETLAAANLRTHSQSVAATTGNERDNISDDSISTPPPNYHEIPGIVPSYHGRTSGPPPAYDEVMNPNGAPPSYQSLFGQVREARKSSNGLVDLLRQLLLVLIGTIGCTMIIGFLLLIPITMIFFGFFYINECRAENIPTFLVVGGFVWIIKNMLNCYNQFKKDSSSVNRPPPRRAPPHLQAGSRIVPAPPLPPAVSSNVLEQHVQEALPQIDIEQQGAETPTTQPNPTATTRTTTDRSEPTVAATVTSQSQNHLSRRHIQQPQMIGLTSDKCESILNYFLIVWFLAGCIVVYRIYEPDYENPLSSNYCHRTIYLYAFWLMTSAFIIIAIVLSCLCCLMASSLMSCSHGR